MNTWTNLKPSGTVPSARADHAMDYDSATHRLIMFGGFDEAGAYLNDTWAYDPSVNTWTELKPSGTLPPARADHSMAYDPSSGLMIVFGGWNGDAGILNDTWAYDSKANSWTDLRPSGNPPQARYGSSMAYDPATRQIVMFGGDAIHGELWDTWAFK